MVIWFVAANHPVPGKNSQTRSMRIHLLAEQLVRLGHEVMFFTSDFDHGHKRKVIEPITERLGVKYVITDDPGYSRHISMARLVHHWISARNIKKAMSELSSPDIIYVNYPTLELSNAVREYSSETQTPYLVCISDLWPDTYVDVVPWWLKWVVWFFVRAQYPMAKRVFSGASGVTGLTSGYLDYANKFCSGGLPDTQIKFVCPMTVPDPKLRWNKRINKPLRWIYAGVLGKSSDVNWLIMAVEAIARRGDIVDIYGSGDALEVLKKRCQANGVTFHGFVAYPELAVGMEHADVGIAPYRCTDNFKLNLPNKVVEYMAFGLAIISPCEGEISLLIDRENIGLSSAHSSAVDISKVSPQDVLFWKKNARRVFEKNHKVESVGCMLEKNIQRILENGSKA